MFTETQQEMFEWQTYNLKLKIRKPEESSKNVTHIQANDIKSITVNTESLYKAFGTTLFITIAQPPPHSPEKGLNEINKIDLVAVSYGEDIPIIINHFHIVLFCLFDGIGNTIIHSKTNNPMTNLNVRNYLRNGIKWNCDY